MMQELHHHKPKGIADHIALLLVLFARMVADVFFKSRYGHRAVVLETIAAVPGMVGAMFQHLRALRHIEDDRGWIRKLLDEAENERMHLMVYVELTKPSLPEKFVITSAQFIFFTVYMLMYVISPRTGHRIVGYLEEEAIKSYTIFLDQIEKGLEDDPPAPQVAIDYWHLPEQATLRDVVIATRADEERHRETNHAFADTLAQ